MKATSWLLLLGVVLLSAGCATGDFTRQAGFEPRSKSIEIKREEPGHGLIIEAATLEDERGLDVVMGVVPNPLFHRRWLEELVDASRPYSFWLPKVGYRSEEGLDCNQLKSPEREKKCKAEQRVLKRLSFRAILYRGETAVDFYDAVINPKVSRSFTLLPFGKGRELGTDLHQLIVSSDGKFGLTTSGELVDLAQVETLGQLPTGFFERHPSPVVIQSKHRETDEGYGFIRLIDQMFPVIVNRGTNRYWGQPDTKVVWQKYTDLTHPFDRILTCVSYRMGPGMMVVGGVVAAVQTGRAIAVDDCLK